MPRFTRRYRRRRPVRRRRRTYRPRRRRRRLRRSRYPRATIRRMPRGGLPDRLILPSRLCVHGRVEWTPKSTSPVVARQKIITYPLNVFSPTEDNDTYNMLYQYGAFYQKYYIGSGKFSIMFKNYSAGQQRGMMVYTALDQDAGLITDIDQWQEAQYYRSHVLAFEGMGSNRGFVQRWSAAKLRGKPTWSEDTYHGDLGEGSSNCTQPSQKVYLHIMMDDSFNANNGTEVAIVEWRLTFHANIICHKRRMYFDSNFSAPT